MDDASRYLDLRDLFVRHVASIDPTASVPACPDWDVHDLVAHQVHQLSSACDGSFPLQDALDAIVAVEPHRRREARTRQDQWVAGAVAARRDVPVADLIAEWDAVASSAPAGALAALFPDLAVHFFDLLGAVGRREHRDDPFLVPALRFWAGNSEIRLQHAGRGPLRLEFDETPEGVEPIGPGDAPLLVGGTPFELLRSIVGRRSPRQADALRWQGADAVARDCFSVYGWRGEDLEE